MTETSSFKPDKAILKSLRGQPLSVLLEYISSGRLPPKFSPAKEERRLTEERRNESKVIRKNGISTADQILALREEYNKIKKALEWYPVALILPVIRYRCTCCNSLHISPQGGELLQYEHPSLGHKAVAIPQHYDTAALPHHLCISDRSGNGCQNCFTGKIVETPVSTINTGG
ncbi:MAG: hypothetical protein ACYC1K_03490 [Minisyncoccota bacterium]